MDILRDLIEVGVSPALFQRQGLPSCGVAGECGQTVPIHQLLRRLLGFGGREVRICVVRKRREEKGGIKEEVDA